MARGTAVVDWQKLAEQMATMARDLLAQDSVGATLERVTACAVEIIGGCDAAGILVIHGKRVETLAPTDGLVVRSDQLQERLVEGPGFDAALLSQPSRRLTTFTQRNETVGWLLASHAVVAFCSARTADQLHQALGTRHTIGQAMGILMERLKISDDDAFNML
ncbi:ANTAR domain-containing protein [Streptomyces melanosporofaciens]|uniref:ANTAR domain-containing protein n=1 Tax=Streptomyces melanosporofaciens TaxID=67327 RepID=UPI000B80B38B|nr:ANTAR domain-containing protein [Streptomyces melanosporofaciens]